MDQTSNIKSLPPSALIPHPRNPRTHTRRQIEQIARSIRTFGFTNPVLVDDEGRILAGHGRVEAARLLGLETVPTLRIGHLSEAEQRAYIIADNKIAENAGWDLEVLAGDLEIINALDVDFDLTLTGFETPELDLLMMENGGDTAETEDHPPQPPEGPPVSLPGDLWVLGRNRLLCGDARIPASFDRLMDGEAAAMVFTDPPYNVRIDRNVCGTGAIRHREFVMASGEMSAEEYLAFLKQTLGNAANAAADGSLHFVCMDWRHIGDLLQVGCEVYRELKNICVWVKDNGGLGSLYRSRHELIAVFKKGKTPHINNVELGKWGRNRTNVWFYPGVNGFHRGGRAELAMHPTVKPLALVSDAICDCSHRGDIVLDAFAGSGTTLIAAEKTGRRAYALELDPLYVDTAVRRWQRATGETAVLERSGGTFAEAEQSRQEAAEHAEANDPEANDPEANDPEAPGTRPAHPSSEGGS